MYDHIIHHDSAHTDKYIIVQGAAMNNGMVADGYIIPDRSPVFFKGAMDAGAVLDIYLIADFDKIHIAADNGIEPGTALVAHNHITHDSGIRGDETIFSKTG